MLHSLNAIRASSFGTPFFFKVIEGEKFAQMKARLIECAKIDGAQPVLADANESQNAKDHALLKDDDAVLAELLRGRFTMIYVSLPGGQAQVQPATGSIWSRGVKIYN